MASVLSGTRPVCSDLLCNNCGSVTRTPAAVPLATPLIPAYGPALSSEVAETTRDNDWLRGEINNLIRQNNELKATMQNRVYTRETARLRQIEYSRMRFEQDRLRQEEYLRAQLAQERERNAINLDKAMRFDMMRQQYEQEEQLRRMIGSLPANQASVASRALLPGAGPVVGGGSTWMKITVVSANGLAIGDYFSSDPYVEICWNDTPTGAKTKTISSSLNPSWNETFCIEVPLSVTAVTCRVWDYDAASKDEFLGQAIIPTANRNLATQTHGLPLQPRPFNQDDAKLQSKNKGSLGALNVIVEWLASSAGQPNPIRAPAALAGAAPVAPIAPGPGPALADARALPVGGAAVGPAYGGYGAPAAPTGFSPEVARLLATYQYPTAPNTGYTAYAGLGLGSSPNQTTAYGNAASFNYDSPALRNPYYYPTPGNVATLPPALPATSLNTPLPPATIPGTTTIGSSALLYSSPTPGYTVPITGYSSSSAPSNAPYVVPGVTAPMPQIQGAGGYRGLLY